MALRGGRFPVLRHGGSPPLLFQGIQSGVFGSHSQIFGRRLPLQAIDPVPVAQHLEPGLLGGILCLDGISQNFQCHGVEPLLMGLVEQGKPLPVCLAAQHGQIHCQQSDPSSAAVPMIKTTQQLPASHFIKNFCICIFLPYHSCRKKGTKISGQDDCIILPASFSNQSLHLGAAVGIRQPHIRLGTPPYFWPRISLFPFFGTCRSYRPAQSRTQNRSEVSRWRPS